MVEWSITVVLKTTVPRGTGGSNPSLSAIYAENQQVARFTHKFTHKTAKFCAYFLLLCFVGADKEMQPPEKSDGCKSKRGYGGIGDYLFRKRGCDLENFFLDFGLKAIIN